MKASVSIAEYVKMKEYKNGVIDLGIYLEICHKGNIVDSENACRNS